MEPIGLQWPCAGQRTDLSSILYIYFRDFILQALREYVHEEEPRAETPAHNSGLLSG
jgi:hypothetical protein